MSDNKKIPGSSSHDAAENYQRRLAAKQSKEAAASIAHRLKGLVSALIAETQVKESSFPGTMAYEYAVERLRAALGSAVQEHAEEVMKFLPSYLLLPMERVACNDDGLLAIYAVVHQFVAVNKATLLADHYLIGALAESKSFTTLTAITKN